VLNLSRISLLYGFAATLTMFLCFKNSGKPKDVPLREKLWNLNLNGAVLLSGLFSCFILAMHWVGIMLWTSVRVVGSFVGFISLFICFAVNECAMGSMVRVHLFTKRLVFANWLYAFCLAGAFCALM
jgi:hypothetical protein